MGDDDVRVDLALRPAVKLAGIVLDLDRAGGFFLPWREPQQRAEAFAVCQSGWDHDAPGADCDCGFRGVDDAATLLDLLTPSLEDLAGAAVLDVELGGVVVADGDDSYRAATQRVLGAAILRWCPACLRAETTRNGAPSLYAVSHGSAWRLAVLCEAHVAGLDALPLSLGDVAGLVGTEVTWASSEVAEGLRWRIESRWSAPQLRGPLALDRHVAHLRMGQLGFVQPSAVRVDFDGVLWVDLRAPAPQRPHGSAVVPVKRPVGFGLEVVATTAAVRRLDARLARARPRLADANEERVSVVRGLRHLPCLAEVLSW